MAHSSLTVEYEGQKVGLAVAIAMAGSVVDFRNASKRIRVLGWDAKAAIEPPLVVRAVSAEEVRQNRRARERARRKRIQQKKKAAFRHLNFSKTSPAYRNSLGPAPEMTRSELRAMLAEAVRNTAGMAA